MTMCEGAKRKRRMKIEKTDATAKTVCRQKLKALFSGIFNEDCV